MPRRLDTYGAPYLPRFAIFLRLPRRRFHYFAISPLKMFSLRHAFMPPCLYAII